MQAISECSLLCGGLFLGGMLVGRYSRSVARPQAEKSTGEKAVSPALKLFSMQWKELQLQEVDAFCLAIGDLLRAFIAEFRVESSVNTRQESRLTIEKSLDSFLNEGEANVKWDASKRDALLIKMEKYIGMIPRYAEKMSSSTRQSIFSSLSQSYVRVLNVLKRMLYFIKKDAPKHRRAVPYSDNLPFIKSFERLIENSEILWEDLQQSLLRAASLGGTSEEQMNQTS